MKHFDKMTAAKFCFSMPQEQSLVHVDVPEQEDTVENMTVASTVWSRVAALIKRTDKPDDLCAIDDITCGFDRDNVSVELWNWDDEAQLNRTITWIEGLVRDAYNEICSTHGVPGWSVNQLEG